MVHFLLVMAGGGLGAGMRHLSGLAAMRLLGTGFPWGTAFVNVLGSFLMGVLIELLARKVDASAAWRLFLATGFLGGFTTFSSFSLDTALLIERGSMGLAFLYVAGSVLIGIAALFAGFAVIRGLV
ncbi:MAG: fluoride efflux transporter CrcB [Fulvimarina manganoxydans]|uniref:fluoride efflux transporter CrcB n=1 Tax=Fulvimarina manganoxydans TaxID=937218 RepID=UPI0023572E53|nr:fluoride efflux transporter CrcB [Fulvimarina manganoxydans]MCK5934312.1 fluoride efflux transporter CrcB [Fulvimarina manganoxydans]